MPNEFSEMDTTPEQPPRPKPAQVQNLSDDMIQQICDVVIEPSADADSSDEITDEDWQEAEDIVRQRSS